MARQATLGEFEQLIMLAILRLGEDAYGVSIRREIVTRTGRSVARGAVYTTLDRLQGKGLLSSQTGAEEEGRSHRRYYDVTGGGIGALQAGAATVRALWDGLETILGQR